MIVRITKEFDADVSGFSAEYVKLSDMSEALAKRYMTENPISADDFHYEAHPELPSDYTIDAKYQDNLFDIVLIEIPLTNGLDVKNLSKMMSHLKNDQVFPLDIEAEFSNAIGFITTEVSCKLDYRHKGLETFIRSILEDMNLENPDGIYDFHGFRVLLKRNF